MPGIHRYPYAKWALLCFFSAAFMADGSYGVIKHKKPLFPNLKAQTQQSALFVRLKDNKVLFQKAPHKMLSPASVTKLFTAAASLHYLGPHYTFKTPLYHTGSRKGPHINGDLIIKGSGDPMFVSEKLWQMAADLRHMGIRNISGDIIIDNSLFDGVFHDKARQGGKARSRHAYDAPLTAFAVNFNTFAVAISPGERVGHRGLVSLDPYPLRGLLVENKTRTSLSHLKTASRVSRITQKNAVKMVVSGQISQRDTVKKIYRSVGDPVKAAGEQVRAFLNKEGILVQGVVRGGLMPGHAKKLLTVTGYPLQKIVKGLNKYSNNYIADVLLKKLATTEAAKGSLENGVLVVKEFLKKEVSIPPTFTLKNGSGLSPENRASAHQIVKILAYMEKRLDLFPEFLNSLPTAGIDGTLKDRFSSMRTKALKGIVRAKTGTLTAPVTVATLAGYLRHKKHGLVAFAILDNGIEGKRQPSLQDLKDRQDIALAKFTHQL